MVLPFANLGGDSGQDYFVDGVTESLTTDLSQMSGMLVIGRNTAFSYKNKPVHLKQIGRELPRDMTSTTIAPARRSPLHKSLFVQVVVGVVLGIALGMHYRAIFCRTFSCENQIFVLFRMTRRIEARLRGTPGGKETEEKNSYLEFVVTH